MPVCNECGQYNISDNLNCSFCLNNKEEVSNTSSKIKNIADHLFKKTKLNQKTDFTPVNPPPPPPRNTTDLGQTTSTRHTLSIANNLINYLDSTNLENISIFRRATCLVFDNELLHLILQIPWITRVSSSIIEINFIKELNSNINNDFDTQNFLFNITLRLRLQFVQNSSLNDYLQNCSVYDEIVLKLSPSFLIINQKPLNNPWYNYLTQSNKLRKQFYYLTRNEPLDSRYYKSFTLEQIEELFIFFIGKILNIGEEINDLSIINKSSKPVILSGPNHQSLSLIEREYSNIDINEGLTYCMGHGGGIETENKGKNRCKICGGELCKICLEAFFICPGSINIGDIHKFLS
jgi:hypothetical protein